ncbi:twin-arginine translocase subunit TatC [Micromonospora aurantiaca]|uniref:Sec-independent protein translocase protein TatC n=1 Tax=Micromonospora aurantiaca (nom. illeg.) TaxID=47850 RepID=A0A3M9KE30_9ACTN|nr:MULTISPECIES: twin-arginine translocase subunit TatC [Micromonospora]ADL46492.1 Sec-independent protein translocase, TatC subunit [Micromonospora aurantiaca ATCC 27029]AXH92478.1 twin-arginine translocase subunit TatC [Micromonospora aurantiaca]MBC9003080.1 twin-arginine translocase subunit TatC [Micromonospora aurantiaca]OHX02483.1 twin arginine-targeting protein translocase TatC [Micromonospora sp. WMMB235]RNH98457.1 twin-arginine translocase subunit TatC [Micromonospora aurantiaca]
MAFGLKKRGPSSFARAADGSMTLIEHIRELRNRLFRASLAILVGFGFGIWLAEPVRVLLSKPYCDLPQSFDAATGKCKFVQLGVADVFLLNLKIGLWVGLIIAAPIWLYQLWAFIAPGLHRHERRYAYVFTALAAPLFAAGAVLAFFVTTKGLEFLLDISGDDIATNLEVTRYISFVTNLILLFGVAFEFPLIVLMLNFVGLASAKRLLSWWRVAVFVFFAFSAVVTPTPDPFGMTALAICLCALYFAAVGVAFINDKRRGRGREVYAGIADDEVSPLDLSDEPVPAGGRIEASEPIGAPEPIVAPKPIERRYDDMT